jgi:hypothetical protein
MATAGRLVESWIALGNVLGFAIMFELQPQFVGALEE